MADNAHVIRLVKFLGLTVWRLYHLASLPLFGVQWCAEHIGLWWGKVVLLRDSGGSSVTLDGLEMCMAHSNAPQERESHRAVVTAAPAVVWVVGIFNILLNLLGMLFLSYASICSLHRLHLFSFFQTCRVQLWMHIQNLRVPISRTPDVEPEGEGELWALGNQKGPMGTKEIAPLRLVGIRCHGIGCVSMKTWKHLRGFWATPKQYGKAQCSIREDFSLGLWSVQLCQLGEWWYEEAHSKSQFLRFSIKTDTPSGSSFAIYRGFRFAGWNLDNFETLGHRRGHSIGTFPKDQPRRRHFPPPIFHTVSILRHEATLIVCWIEDDLIHFQRHLGPRLEMFEITNLPRNVPSYSFYTSCCWVVNEKHTFCKCPVSDEPSATQPLLLFSRNLVGVKCRWQKPWAHEMRELARCTLPIWVDLATDLWTRPSPAGRPRTQKERLSSSKNDTAGERFQIFILVSSCLHSEPFPLTLLLLLRACFCSPSFFSSCLTAVTTSITHV